MKGVPLRLEIGPRDVKQGEYVAVRRDTSEKLTQSKASAPQDIKQLLGDIQKSLLDKWASHSPKQLGQSHIISNIQTFVIVVVCFRATKELEEHTVVVENFSDFIPELDKKNIILSPFCGEGSCEEKIKKESTRSVLYRLL